MSRALHLQELCPVCKVYPIFICLERRVANYISLKCNTGNRQLHLYQGTYIIVKVAALHFNRHGIHRRLKIDNGQILRLQAEYAA